MMKEEGKYSHFWMKYTAVIHVLLKKTENENQKLQLYKHEFENIGHRRNAPVSFSLNLINGRAQNIVSSTAIARDLWRVLDNHPATRNWLKERNVKISIEKNYELQFEKIQPAIVEPADN
jgi:hypothetical protein